MLKIGIVGAGNIGSIIAEAIDEGMVKAALVALADRNTDRARHVAAALKQKPAVLPVAELITAADLVIEAAGHSALEEIVPEAVSRGKDVLVMSIGGLLGREEWFALAEKSGARIYCPSGAIGGLDAVRGARIGEIQKVTIVTRKHPRSLQGAPYLVSKNIDLDDLAEERVVFRGNARDACKGFPANVNVSAALSLAGVGADRTEVTIVADPSAQHNIHDIEVIGEFGRLYTRVENVPTRNPRTAKLAAFSAIALLKGLTSPLRIGT